MRGIKPQHDHFFSKVLGFPEQSMERGAPETNADEINFDRQSMYFVDCNVPPTGLHSSHVAMQARG